jgi:hypothetical protein
LVVSESTTQSVTGMGGAGVIELRQPARDCGSHSSNHSVEDADCCGGGSVNERPTCYTGKPYWGAAKKVCGVNQYGAPPMDGSKKGGQAGALAAVPVGVPTVAAAAKGPAAPTTGSTCCIRKPYWGAVKRACGVDQYEAPPMAGLKDGQAGAPATVAVAKGPMVPAAAPAGALAKKGRPTEGWGREAMAAPAVVPAATTTPTTRSWEAATAWTVAMVAARSAEATPAVAEATAMMSMAGGYAM